jgi:hypothetical protein
MHSRNSPTFGPMFPRFLAVCILVSLHISVLAQEKFTIVKDLAREWMTYRDGAYEALEKIPFTGLNTVYSPIDIQAFTGHFLRVQSHRTYFLFINGKVVGEYQGEVLLSIDSLAGRASARPARIAIHQEKINGRDLRCEIVMKGASGRRPDDAIERPYSHFRDFVVISGLVIIMVFVAIVRISPKLASDYFSLSRLISSREADDSQASARLTSGSNVRFYIFCSLMIGYYLMIIFYNLPHQYTLPIRFHASTFWTMCWEWLKLSSVVFSFFLLKLVVIFLLTRLFDMRGMARYHFFNWVRLLLVVFGVFTVLIFMYFILRGDHPDFFVGFLSMVIIALIAWIVMAVFKFTGRTGHSMFHLFSYLCATEIIPLLITVKILFQ